MFEGVTKPSSHIATQDPITGDAMRIADDSIVWSSATRWNGIVVELHRYDRLDTPVFCVPDHVVALHRPIAARVDIELSGICRTHSVRRGVVTLIPAGVPRRVRQGAGELLVITVSPLLIERSCGLKRWQTMLDARCVVEDAQIVRIAAALEAEAIAGYPTGPLYGESLGIALAAHLASRYARSDESRDGGGLAGFCLRRVLQYIDDLAADVRLDALAHIAGLSQHRFAHNFKMSVGLSPHQFVIRRRIELAKPMLRDTNDSIASVTYALGFGSPSRFTYLFRRETGVTPSRYRASFR